MFILMALGLLAQGEATAEETFKKIEETVVKAPALRVKFSFQAVPRKEGDDARASGSGTMLLKGENKSRVELEATVKGSTINIVTVCDGTRMKTTFGPQSQEKEAPKDARERLGLAFVRVGCFASFMAPKARGGETDVRKLFPVSDFKKGDDDGKAATLTFKVARAGEIMDARLWYDAKTHRLFKLALDLGPERGTITETYKEFVLDEDIPDEKFDLKQP
jgi:outer membrane lipoprotein-sorting protein